MSETTTPVNLNKKALLEMIASEAKNYLSADGAAQVEDIVKRSLAEWERKTTTEQRQTVKSARKAAEEHIFGQYKAAAAELDKVLPTIEGKNAFSGESAAALFSFLTQSRKMSQSDLLKHAESQIEAGKLDPYIGKALAASTLTAGGALIPIEYSADFIGYLYNKTAVRRMGARTVSMEGGNLSIGKQNGTATAYWMAENDRITVSEQTFGQLVLSAKKLGIMTPISNDLLRRTPAGFLSLVRDDMMAVAARAEDAALIRGTGTDGQPLGIRDRIASGNVITANSAPTLAEVYEDLFTAMYRVDAANIPGLQNGWMFNPRIKFFLMSLITTDGYPVFLMEMKDGTLLGEPFADTNSIPRNLGGGGDETEIYYGDFSQVVIGETANLEVETSPDASYVDASGNTVSSFQNDQTVIRVIHEVDVTLKHSEAFARLDAVDWGASFDA